MTRPFSPLRVTIQQPSLAKYRLPVYRELARTPGIDLKIVYGKDPGVPNVEPEGLNASFEPHRHLGLGRHRPFVWQPAQLKYAHRDHTDVLIMVWNTRWLSLPLALRKARNNGVRTVVWGHGYSKNESPRRAALRKKLGLMADAILFYSRTIADQYIDQGVDPNRVFVAPNCLDQQPIQAARTAWLENPERLEAFRRERGVPPEAEPILYVSRFDPANRVDLLIRAAAQLAPQRPHLRLHLIGKGDTEIARLKALAQELGIADRVRFLGAIYDENLIAPWFLTAKAFCYPANIGLSIHHAMGYGLPVITGDDPSSHNPEIELIEGGRNGRLFKHAQAPSLANHLDETLNDEPQRLRMSQEAHQTVTERHTLQSMTQGFIDAITGTSSRPTK